MVTLSLVLCGVLLLMVISGKRRVWWLLGLAPILALFVRGFSPVYHPVISVLQSPHFVSVEECGDAVPDSDHVVGLIFDQRAHAIPYRALAQTPLIVLSGQDSRSLMIWSITANCATVLPMARDCSPRDIEVVSRPADSLLLFDTRLGQFIVGVTGKTVAGAEPSGFGKPMAVEKTTWADWRTRHPQTRVLLPSSTAAEATSHPVLPLLQFKRGPGMLSGDAQICLIGTPQPVAVQPEEITEDVLNTKAGDSTVLLGRDPKTENLRAFDRHLSADLFLTFRPLARRPRKHPDAAMVDDESGSLWTLDGRAVDGPLKGQRLAEIPVENGLYWGVMKFWMPDLMVIHPQTQ
jgi:hypothetical protein